MSSEVVCKDRMDCCGVSADGDESGSSSGASLL